METTKVVNFFISLADFPWLSLLRIFFSLTTLKPLESWSFELQILFLVDYVRFFLAELVHFKQKNSFWILTSFKIETFFMKKNS